MPENVKPWVKLLKLVRDYEESRKQVENFQEDEAFIAKLQAAGYTLNYQQPGWEIDTARIILEYLNEKAGTKFPATYKGGKLTAGGRLLVSRIQDGFTTDDLKSVIDKKCHQWLDTKEAIWLRPETLFNKTKFESYYGATDGKQPI